MDHVTELLEPAAAYRELKELLRQRTCLPAGPGQPILQPDGRAGGSLFYTWACILDARGLRLGAACLLERLHALGDPPLAACGIAGLPLVSACLALGPAGGQALFVRSERKRYGSSRQVEGVLAPDRPLFLVDDVLGTGGSMQQAIAALEEAGYTVGGCLALAEFARAGGRARLEAQGLAVHTIFEAEQDLGLNPPGLPRLHQGLLPDHWGTATIPAGLDPASAARRVAEAWLRTGEVPCPPACFDQPVDGRGGVFVSFRVRDSDQRVHRDGFWHFDPAQADPPRDLVLATVATLRHSPSRFTLEALGELKIAVSFLGPLEPIRPAQLDFLHHGIVVYSPADGRLGGALPNTQYFSGEIGQYRQARRKNAGLQDDEPHTLLHHTLTKHVEPGEYWLPFGSPPGPDAAWAHDPAVGRSLTARAQELLHSRLTGTPATGAVLSEELIPAPVFAVGVSLFGRGLLGCTLAYEGTLDECLARAVDGALADGRFEERRAAAAGDEPPVLTVSVLHDREWIGNWPLEAAVAKMRPGQDSLGVAQGERAALFLPYVPVWFDWEAPRTGRELLVKAGITHEPCDWAIYPTESWLLRGGQVVPLDRGFPRRTPRVAGEAADREDLELLGGWLLRNLGPDGLPLYAGCPFTNERQPRGDSARQVHGLLALQEAGRLLGRDDWLAAARRGLLHCVGQLAPLPPASSHPLDSAGPEGPGGPAAAERLSLNLPHETTSVMADCLLLAALAGCQLDSGPREQVRGLVRRVQALCLPDGRITEHPRAHGLAADHAHLPGAALLALARYQTATGEAVLPPELRPCLRWYQRRFTALKPWGMVGWQPQGWAAVAEASGWCDPAAHVFAIVDWALEQQHAQSGAFLCELDPRGHFGFISGFLCEGVAAAWALARRVGDHPRARRYARSCEETFRFARRLMIRPEDTFLLPEPEPWLGAVRGTICNGDVRVDYASHLLLALVQAARLAWGSPG